MKKGQLILFLIWLQNIYQKPGKFFFTSHSVTLKALEALKLVKEMNGKIHITTGGKNFLIRNLETLKDVEESQTIFLDDPINNNGEESYQKMLLWKK
jgi:hypothetical protein